MSMSPQTLETSPAVINCSSIDGNSININPTLVLLKGKLVEWNEKVEGLAGLEARGITRVLPEEKQGGGARGQVQMFLLWFSINLVWGAMSLLDSVARSFLGLAGRIQYALSSLPVLLVLVDLHTRPHLDRKLVTEQGD